jgi:hypothetical protein
MAQAAQLSVLSTGLPNAVRKPRQVFVAYPYTLYDKADYRRPFTEVGKAFDVQFVFADQKITTLHILQKIADYIRSSRLGIYDISGWNANVTLELGLAYGMGEKAYVITNPKQHAAGEVPSDLRGLDRLQYTSFNQLQAAIEQILTQELPIQPTHTVEGQLDSLREQVERVVGESEGLRIADLASLMGVSVEVAKLVVHPLVGKSLRTEGTKKGTRYFPVA